MIVGAVVSRLTFTETGPADPTTFVAVQERVKFPSVENVSSAQPVFVVAAPPSVTCQASAILPDVYQPFGPLGAAGSSVYATVGATTPVAAARAAPPPTIGIRACEFARSNVSSVPATGRTVASLSLDRIMIASRRPAATTTSFGCMSKSNVRNVPGASGSVTASEFGFSGSCQPRVRIVPLPVVPG